MPRHKYTDQAECKTCLRSLHQIVLAGEENSDCNGPPEWMSEVSRKMALERIKRAR